MHIFGPILAVGLMPYLMGSVQCNDASSRHPAPNIIQRRADGTPTYSTIHPGGLAEYEGRSNNTHATPENQTMDAHATSGNHTMEGLSQTIDFVTRTYGLKDSESFYWGIDGNPYANLTAFADGKEVKVLSLERFSDVLQAAKCNNNSVKLTFHHEVAFDQVHQAWQWIDDADENYVILVTESDRCNIADGDPSVRQPWHVTSAAFNDDTNEVTLTAEPRTWDQAFSNWHLKLDTRGVLSQTQQQKLLRRNLQSQKRKRITSSKSIPLDKDFSGSDASLDTLDGPSDVKGIDAGITCANCHTDGSIDLDIDVSPKISFKGAHLEGYVKFFAANVSATIQLNLTATGAGVEFNGSFTVIKWKPIIPGPGLYIPGVIDLGPEIKYDIQYDVGKLNGSIDLTTGVVVRIPPNSIYRKSLDDSNKDEITDWTPTIESLPTDYYSSADLAFAFGGALKLDLVGEIVKVASAEIGLALVAPNITGSFTTSTNPDHCDDSKGMPGDSLEVNVEMALKAYEITKLKLVEATTAEQTFFSTATQVYSTCIEADPETLSTAAA